MVRGDSLVDAWAKACGLLKTTRPMPQFIVLSVLDGSVPADTEVARWDRAAGLAGCERPSAVAEVLMPRRVLAFGGGADDAIKEGLRLFGRARRRNIRFSGWRDTYFERLTGNGHPDGQDRLALHENRLHNIILKLRNWRKNVSAALYAHTSSERDRLRTRGAPCLQYVQFEPTRDGRLNLIALYRSHDYAHKALGNLIGLSRLLTFVARHSGRTIGGITIFSIHPTVGAHSRNVEQYVATVIK